MLMLYLPAALPAAQICRYLVYAEADIQAFRPAGVTLCTDGGEIWHGGGPLLHAKCMEEGTEGPLLHAKFHPHRCNDSRPQQDKCC